MSAIKFRERLTKFKITIALPGAVTTTGMVRGGGGGGVKAFLQLANYTLGPDATLYTEIYKNSVRIKAPNSVNSSKRKHKYQINHDNKQRRVLYCMP